MSTALVANACVVTDTGAGGVDASTQRSPDADGAGSKDDDGSAGGQGGFGGHGAGGPGIGIAYQGAMPIGAVLPSGGVGGPGQTAANGPQGQVIPASVPGRSAGSYAIP